MIKTFALALCASVAVAAATLESVDIRVDEDASTKKLGVVAWQPFYQRYINQLFSSATDAPDSFNSESHLCWWQWRVEQPFQVDDRYSIAVTHNCPVEFISSITFDVTWEEVNESSAIVHDDDTDGPDAELLTGVKGVVVFAKTEAGWGVDQDFGFWHPKLDGAPSWTYAYTVNYAKETPAVEAPVVEPSPVVRLDTSYVLPAYEGELGVGRADMREYTKNEGVFELDDDFVMAGTVTLTLIEGEYQGASIYYAYGCRRLTFTNGEKTVQTGWLGGEDGCGKIINGSDAVITVMMEPNFSEGLFFESSDDYYPAHLQTLGFQINDQRIGSPTRPYTNTVEVSATQRICGVSWFRNDWMQNSWPTPWISVLWRPTVCEIQGSVE